MGERAAGTPTQGQSGAGRRECLPSAPLPLTGDSCPCQSLLGARRRASSSPHVKCFRLLSSSAGSLGSRLAHRDAADQQAWGLPSSHSQWGAELGVSASLGGVSENLCVGSGGQHAVVTAWLLLGSQG